MLRKERARGGGVRRESGDSGWRDIYVYMYIYMLEYRQWIVANVAVNIAVNIVG